MLKNKITIFRVITWSTTTQRAPVTRHSIIILHVSWYLSAHCASWRTRHHECRAAIHVVSPVMLCSPHAIWNSMYTNSSILSPCKIITPCLIIILRMYLQYIIIISIRLYGSADVSNILIYNIISYIYHDTIMLHTINNVKTKYKHQFKHISMFYALYSKWIIYHTLSTLYN